MPGDTGINNWDFNVMHTFQMVNDPQKTEDNERLAYALKASGICIWDVNLIDGNVWLDQNFRTVFNITDQQEISYEQLREKIFPPDFTQLQQKITAALHSTKQQDLDFEFRAIGASRITPEWFSCKGTIYVNNDNKPYRFSGTAQNIAKQKQAEDDASGFRYMADHAMDAFILMKQDGTFAYLNQVALDRWGYTSEQVENLRVPDVDPIYNAELFSSVFIRAQKEMIPPFETIHKRKDGSVFDVEVNMGGFQIGSEPYMLAVARDITGRKQIRQQLDENQLKLQSIISSAPVGIALFVGENQVIEMPNKVFIELTGKGPDVAGLTAWDVTDQIKLNDVLFSEIIKQVMLSGKAVNNYACAVQRKNPEGVETAYYDFSHIPISDIDGKIFAVLEMAVDVTSAVISRQQLQESEARYKLLTLDLEELVSERTGELADANQELVILNEELSVTNEELTASNEETISANEKLAESNHMLAVSNESLAKFAYVASHDLQEPLRKVQQFGDLLIARYGEQLGEGIDYLERMQNASGRMSTLIQDLLTYSGISSKKETTVSVYLKEVIDTVKSDLDFIIDKTGAEITIHKPLPQINGIASQLEQLFQNLISNAIKFSKSNQSPVIEISHNYVPYVQLPLHVKPSSDAKIYHCIEVKDYGIGFDQQYADRIFEVFQRLHGKSEFSGTGIGLAICAKVASNHGGAITASGKIGEGAIFRVYFPI